MQELLESVAEGFAERWTAAADDVARVLSVELRELRNDIARSAGRSSGEVEALRSMIQRGRKSTKSSSLSIVPPVEPLPPEPHPSMSPGAVEVWNEVLSAVHHAAFRGAEFLLEAYCRTVAFERRLGREVEALPPGPARNQAAAARRAEANLAVLLATKLRLTPKSRTDKNIKLRTVPPGPKPWEIPADRPPDES